MLYPYIIFIYQQIDEESYFLPFFISKDMYLGSWQPIPEPSVLQLTGQLIMTHPAHPHHLQYSPPYPPYSMPSDARYPMHPRSPHYPHAVRSPPPPQSQRNPQPYYPLPFPANHLSQPQSEHPQQPSLQHPFEEAREREESSRQAVLEERLEYLENMCSNISKVNAQTLEAFRDIRKQLFDRITVHPISSQNIKNVQQMEAKLKKNSEQLLDKEEKIIQEEQEKLDIKRKQLQSHREDKEKQIMEKKKVQTENIKKEKPKKVMKQMSEYQASTEEKIQKQEDDLKRIQTSTKEAEKRAQEQIKKCENQQRKNEDKNNLMAEKWKEQKKQGKKKREVKQRRAINVMRTSNTKFFAINHNTITKSRGDNECKMVLLDVVIGEGAFSFRCHIHTRQSYLWIGVTDRVAQKGRDCTQSVHSIKYDCSGGRIFYASGEGKYQKHDGGMVVESGMELLCEVDREKCWVTFTVLQEEASLHTFRVHSPILKHPHRQFVPFCEMQTRGDAVSWELL